MSPMTMAGVSLLSVAPLLAATAGGGWLLGRVPQAHLKRAVFGFLFLMGLKYMLFL